MSPTFLRALERFILPNACVSCERAVNARVPDTLLCAVCRARMRRLPPGCPRCRQPAPPVGPCRYCAPWPPGLRWAHSAVWIGPEVRALVHHLKYDGYPALARVAAEMIVRTCGQRLPPRAILVPIPLTPRRLRVRGYNQAALIAQALGRHWELPCVDTVLCRRREAGSQTALTPNERARNVEGAFQAVPPPKLAPPASAGPSTVDSADPPPSQRGAEDAVLPTIILVDDVLTTGATVAAASTMLAAAGWPEMAAITFARAMPYELRALRG